MKNLPNKSLVRTQRAAPHSSTLGCRERLEEADNVAKSLKEQNKPALYTLTLCVNEGETSHRIGTNDS